MTHTRKLLVTGGARGIGAAIVRRSLADGLDVAVIDRDPCDVPGVTSVRADLSDDAQTEEALRAILADGPVTRLVNNVGAVFPGPVEDQTPAQLQAACALNLGCALACVRAVLPGMKEAGFGRIVSMASRAALGKEDRTVYAATKAGVIGMTRVWALELGAYGITANAVGPGPIATDLFTAANPPGAPRTEAIIAAVPVRRMGTPEDVAGAVAYFLDERSGFTTGQTLYVCGGLTVGSVPL